MAILLGLPADNIRVIFVRGSGCYGINGADTVSYDAALMSMAVGKPVRVELSRRDEVGWENYGMPFVVDQRAGVDAQGNVVAWDYEASFQVVVRSYPTIATYLARHANAHVREGKIVQQGPLDVRGQRAHWMRVVPLSGEMLEDHVFLESGDGRVVIVIMEAPTSLRQDFGPWFDAMLGSLEVRAMGPPPGANP